MIEETPTPSPWADAVIAVIAEERERQRMPVSEISALAGIHPNSWPRYMSGERRVTIDLVERFAIALGVDIAVLLARATERTKESKGEGRRTQLEVVRNGLDGAEGEAPPSR
jgi:transcriptional regulator with XRE-family HTH domain